MYDCLIIGHSGGLGNEIFKLHKNPLGVSLDNGYDISNFSSREKIVKNAKDIAIIYIVASSNENRFAQIDMLSELWDEYKDQHKKIVVISGSSPQTRNRKNESTQQKRYDASKHALDEIALNLSTMEKNCQVINIKPGRFNSSKYNDNKDKHLIDKTMLALAIFNIVEASTHMRIISTTIVSCPVTGINGKSNN
jgi:NAD(P)-dependent dehydrogenase (short-subunit alcohol dehydrogenase family)|tara:strand:- start:1254 stop:1835 length:582 start_codon:yes stop_codon:yes gene_type:complete